MVCAFNPGIGYGMKSCRGYGTVADGLWPRLVLSLRVLSVSAMRPSSKEILESSGSVRESHARSTGRLPGLGAMVRKL